MYIRKRPVVSREAACKFRFHLDAFDTRAFGLRQAFSNALATRLFVSGRLQTFRNHIKL
jgi:hypothetical protein